MDKESFSEPYIKVFSPVYIKLISTCDSDNSEMKNFTYYKIQMQIKGI